MWSDGRSQASIKANSFSTARTCHTRMVLPAAGAGRQGCNFVVRWAGVSMHSACCCVICCLGSAPSKNHNQLYVRMKMNKASYRNPGKLFSAPAVKKNEPCHAARHTAWMMPRPRPMCPDSLPVPISLVFRLQVLVRSDMSPKRQKNHKHNYTFIELLVCPCQAN